MVSGTDVLLNLYMGGCEVESRTKVSEENERFIYECRSIKPRAIVGISLVLNRTRVITKVEFKIFYSTRSGE